MTKDSNLGPALIKLNGLSQEELLAQYRAKLEELLQRDYQRVKFLRWLAFYFLLFSLVSVLSLAASYLFHIPSGLLEVLLIYGAYAFVGAFVIKIVASFLARSADYRAMQMNLAAMELALRQPPATPQTEKDRPV